MSHLLAALSQLQRPLPLVHYQFLTQRPQHLLSLSKEGVDDLRRGLSLLEQVDLVCQQTTLSFVLLLIVVAVGSADGGDE